MRTTKRQSTTLWIALMLTAVFVFLLVVKAKHSSLKKPSPVHYPAIVDQASSDTRVWSTYKSTKFGFTIQYPQDISITAHEINTKALYKIYLHNCTTSILDGCGGSRWPDYLLTFQDQHGKSKFMIDIYQLPMSQYFGGVEHSTFTFLVRVPYNPDGYSQDLDPLSSSDLDRIQSSMKFIEPTKPLSCLWSIETGKVFAKNSLEVRQEPQKLSLLDGFYFDSVQNACFASSYYTWKGQESEDALPFTSKDTCVSLCVKK